MNRREFIRVLGGAAAMVPLAASAPAETLPAVGLLRSTPYEPFADLLAALREGLKEAGYVDGRDVTILQRYADNKVDRLPRLAADLVHRRVAVIVGNISAVKAAKAATATVPIVFVAGDDPVKSGLVTNIGRPEGNVTGVTFFGGGRLSAKRMELLHDLVPAANVIFALVDPTYPGSKIGLPGLRAAGEAIGRRVIIVEAASEKDFEPVFARIAMARADALLVAGSPLFTSRRKTLVALAERYAIPTIYDLREFALAGGLISYAASIRSAYRQAGIYAGRILKGAKPSDLPVVQPTTLELVVNLKTARKLGIKIPRAILMRADEVIE